ncbi:MAG: DUF2017 family protein [Actinobacteria bacterium]|nr:DUF2017 family protein [Actinomycetota bacterium]
MFFSRQIERRPDGRFRLRLREGERMLLRRLYDDLAELLTDPDDPALRRLFPPGHADPETEEQYQKLVRDQLVSGRAQVLDVVRSTLSEKILTEEEADAWLRGLNDLRLVLGTRLDVSEETDFEVELDAGERGRGLAVYAYLTWLQEQFVEALSPT